MNSARLRCNPIHLPGKQCAFLIRRDGGRAAAYSAGAVFSMEIVGCYLSTRRLNKSDLRRIPARHLGITQVEAPWRECAFSPRGTPLKLNPIRNSR